jgi:hypothetical protein
MFTLHAVGDWRPGHVRLVRAHEKSREIVSDVERVIDETWRRVTGRPGVQLFDGPMYRLESFDASPALLRLSVSSTSYKPFVGTNLFNPQLATQYGPGVLANPVGVSTLVHTADDFLMLGRRNTSVAYYPDRVHPFAGTIDPEDGDDPFVAAQRELKEELRLSGEHISGQRCVGLVEDNAILQPELIFVAGTTLSRDQIQQHVDCAEHSATWSTTTSRPAIDAALLDPVLTPVAVAGLTLWSRTRAKS